jgi:HEXXH motif-containing protein
VPLPGSNTTRAVLSAALGRVARELPALLSTHGVGESRDDARAVERALALLSRREPGALLSVLRRPHASTLIRALRLGAPGGPEAIFAELLAVLALDLAWLGALPCSVRLRRMPPRLVSLTARAALRVPETPSSVTFENGALTIERPGGPRRLDLHALAGAAETSFLTRPYRTVKDDIVLALADNNPFSGVEAHPDKKTPNDVDLGGRSEDEWLASIRGALAIVERHLPAMASDIDVALQQIVPTGYDPERHLSCSYREDVGTIYVSLHPSPLTMAEALIHEVSHNKLNALFELDPLLENGPDERYASPVRPDPRPLHGVLLAVHAFVPIARLYERMLDEDADEPESMQAVQGEHAAQPAGAFARERLAARLGEIVRANRAGFEVLRAHARPTRVGRFLLAELEIWDQHFRARAC